MRLLLVSAYGLPHVGGIEVAVDQLAKELTRRGNEVTHLTSSSGSTGGLPEPGYRVVRVPAINPLEAWAGVPYPLFSPRLLSVLRREISEADIVHSHGYLYPGSVATNLVRGRGRLRAPFVLTEHVGHVPYDSRVLDRIEAAAIRGIGRRTLEGADTTVTYNDRVADQLAALCPGISLRTILNGVDHELLRPAAAGERARLRTELGWDDRPRALFVGRPVAKKGFPEAVAAVHDADVPISLVVAGAISLPPGTPSDVEPLGVLPRERLAEIYRACDVMLVPARGEGFPLSVQEGMASGLPVLLLEDRGYAANLAGAGAGARLVADTADLPRALSELATDPTQLAEAKVAAARHAKNAFSWQRAAGEHEDLYRDLLDGKPEN